MGNKARPIIPIMLDKERHLLLNLNAMVDFEEATGKNMLQQKTLDDLSAKDLRALLWGCLKHEDKELTIEQVGGMIHAGNMEEISASLTKAWELASPKVEETENPLPPSGSNG